MNLRDEAERYRSELEFFIKIHDLPPHWFDKPDYFAIKAYSKDAYTRTIEQLMLGALDMVSEWKPDKRRVAVIKLLGRYSIDMTMEFSDKKTKVEWLRIAEDKPDFDDEYTTPVVLDHMGVYFERGLIPIRNVLRRRGIDYLPGFERYDNSRHEWLSALINRKIPADELRFNEARLEDITMDKVILGHAERQ